MTLEELLKEVGEPVLYAELAEEPHALFTFDQVAAAVLKATKPLIEEIGGWKKDQKENMDIIFKQQGEINELRAQLSAAQEEIVFASKDSLRLLETVKYLRGIAERGEVREQSEDETVEQFVLGYVKKLEDQLAKAEQRVAEACALACEDVIGNTANDQRMIAAIDCSAMIHAGEWRKFVKEV